MTTEELRLECMRLAMDQARRENKHADRDAVAEIFMWFYNRITESERAPPVNRGRKFAAADKSSADILS